MPGRDRVGQLSACGTGEHSTSAAGGRGPYGSGGSAPTEGDLPTAENACAGAVLVTASALPGRIPAPWPGTQARWGTTGDRGCGCAGRGCLSAWGLVAGVGVDVSRSAVLGFLSATHPAAVKLIDALRSHYSAPALMCATDTLYRHATDRGEKVAVHMGGYQCRL